MKILNFNSGHLHRRMGIWDGDLKQAQVMDVTDLAGADFMSVWNWLQQRTSAEAKAQLSGAARFRLADVTFNSPVASPGKVLAAPINYKLHIEEMRNNGQSYGHIITDIRKAGIFLKASSSVVGASQGVAQRFLDRRTDHEIELCVVMGRSANCVSKEEALSYVAGYCLGLDMTIRGPEDRSFRKSIDSYTVLGPWVVTADEGLNPDKIDVQIDVNGQPRQNSNTSDMVMSVAELIEFASSFYTLEPGDVLMTGTPQGVGPVRPGDVMLAKGSGLGEMTVHVRAA
jgi:2-keto-4-pentenoate hydratase/2-oxohepta-3-ene-1,7-dioic acid hydratase in catechol pathway